MKVDVVASMPHYRAHMLPIFEKLPPEMQGTVHPFRTKPLPPQPGRVAMVASWQDVRFLRDVTPMIYVEHGAGQTYGGDPTTALQPGYSGSGGHRHHGVIGFIAPSQTVADRWVTAPSVAVGCPKLDQYHGTFPLSIKSVCFAFHWDSGLAPETRSAFAHYQPTLPRIVDSFRSQGFGVYGHAHPKWDGALDDQMRAAGINAILDNDRSVFHTASILIVDNSSLGAEFMALGRPVIWLNAPWYRRDINHGGRFWNWTAGIPTINDPEALLAVRLANVTIESFAARERIADSVYAYRDGTSSERAAAFIVERLSTM